MKNISFKVEDELHKRFKIHCTIKDVDIKRRIIELMEKDMEERKQKEQSAI